MSVCSLTLSHIWIALAQEMIPGRFVLFEGPRGTGKTRGILTAIVSRALRYPGSRWLLARSTRTRLSQSVLVTLEEQVLPEFGVRLSPAGRENRTEYRLRNSSTLIPMGLDDPQRTQSVELAGIYVAEGVEIESIDQVTALAGTMRQAIPGLKHQCIVDCNPGPPGHWLNQIAEPTPNDVRKIQTPRDYVAHLDWARRSPPKDRWKRIPTRLCHNVAYWDLQRWAYTQQGSDYVQTLSNLQGHLKRRWLDGEWVAASGTVFPEFDPARHVIDPFTIPSDWPWWVGVDPGYDHPCAILWFTRSPAGTLYIADELYRGGLSIAQHAQDIRRRNAGRTIRGYYGDPQHILHRTAQSPKSIGEQFRDCGLIFQPWPRSRDKRAMVESVRDRLVAEPPTLKVFRTCTNTINEFQSWRYRRVADDQLPKGDDQYEDRDNHAMDVVCGIVALRLDYKPPMIEVY